MGNPVDVAAVPSRLSRRMPVDRETLLPPLDENQDDPVAWSLRLQALVELRALSEDLDLPEPSVRLT
jgi:hypothetical protein